MTGQLDPEQFLSPELTRQEYIRMPQTAKSPGGERGCLPTRLFATTGLAVLDPPQVTAEVVMRGRQQVSLYIQEPAQGARLPAEKGNVRCLRQPY